MKRVVFTLLVISSLLSARDYAAEAEARVNSYATSVLGDSIGFLDSAIKHQSEALKDTNKYSFEQCVAINFKAVYCTIDYAEKMLEYYKAVACITKLSSYGYSYTYIYSANKKFVSECTTLRKQSPSYFDLAIKYKAVK